MSGESRGLRRRLVGGEWLRRLICWFSENPAAFLSSLQKQGSWMKKKDNENGKLEGLFVCLFVYTFSSSSLVGDLKALLTAVNHELPPFFPIEFVKWASTAFTLRKEKWDLQKKDLEAIIKSRAEKWYCCWAWDVADERDRETLELMWESIIYYCSSSFKYHHSTPSNW